MVLNRGRNFSPSKKYKSFYTGLVVVKNIYIIIVLVDDYMRAGSQDPKVYD